MDKETLAAVEAAAYGLKVLIAEAMKFEPETPERHDAIGRLLEYICQIDHRLLREVIKHERDITLRSVAALGLIRYADVDDGTAIEEKILTVRWLSRDNSFYSRVNECAAGALERLEAKYRPWEKVLHDRDASPEDKIREGTRCVMHAFYTCGAGRLYSIAMDGFMPMALRVEAGKKLKDLVAAGNVRELKPEEIWPMMANLGRMKEVRDYEPAAGPEPTVSVAPTRITLDMGLGNIGTPEGRCEFVKRVARERLAKEEATKASSSRIPETGRR